MSKTRVKSNTGLTFVSLPEAENLLREFSESQSRTKVIEGEIELAVQQIREAYSSELTALQEVQKRSQDRLQIFAETNREAYFSSKKSLDLMHGKIGFRIGNLSLKKPTNKTWDIITAILQNVAPRFVRTKTEPNKELLIAEANSAEAQEIFANTGLSIAQTETFYIESKTEDYDN